MEPEFIKAHRKRITNVKTDFDRVEKKKKEGKMREKKVTPIESHSSNISPLAAQHFSQKKS